MIRGIAFALLLSMATISGAEAKLLPAGTRIIYPDGTQTILTADGFLLTRPDMDNVLADHQAAESWKGAAMAEASINKGLKEENSQLKTDEYITMIAGGALCVASFLLGHSL